MSDKNQDKKGQSGKAPNGGDSESSLQEELGREATEGGDSIGDVRSNRTLSGSSTWDTLPSDGKDAADDSATKGKAPKPPEGSERAPK